MQQKANLIFHLRAPEDQIYYVINYSIFEFGHQFTKPQNLSQTYHWLHLNLIDGRTAHIPIDNVAYIEQYDGRLESYPHRSAYEDTDGEKIPGHLR